MAAPASEGEDGLILPPLRRARDVTRDLDPKAGDDRAPEVSLPERGARAGVTAAAFGVIALLAGADAFGDLQEGIGLWNVVLDLALTAGAILAGCYFFWQFLRATRRAGELIRALGDAREDAEHWRIRSAQVLPALGAAILRQFERWGLSDDEQELALLVLNGVALEEIARRRHSDPMTIQRLAEVVYRKAGVADSCGLASYFVRDLMILAGQGRR